MKYRFVLLLVILNAGCSNTPSREDVVATLIKQRQTAIVSQLPVKNGQYVLMKSFPSRKDTLELLITDTRGASPAENTRFLNDFADGLCNGIASGQLLQAGGNYQLVLRRPDASRQTVLINRVRCHES